MRELPPPPSQRPSNRPLLPPPVIRGASVRAPVVKLPVEEPLPQFMLWSDDTSDSDATLKRPTPRPPVVDLSDADVTLPRPSRVPAFDDPSDHAPTVKKNALSPSEAAAVLLARRFRATTQLKAEKIEETRPRADTLRPVVSAESTEELELDEIEELPLPGEQRTAPVADASAQVRIDFDDAEEIPLVPDTTLEVLALQRRRHVRRFGSRVLAGAVAVGVILLGVGGIRLGARELAQNLEISSIEVTYTTPSVKTAEAATTTKVATIPKSAPTPTPEAIKPTPVPPKPTPKPVPAPKAATTSVATTPKKPTSKMGVLHTPASAAGHRVYVDGFLSGFAPNPIALKCGTHTVKVGSAAKWQTINVPCGGDAYAK